MLTVPMGQSRAALNILTRQMWTSVTGVLQQRVLA